MTHDVSPPARDRVREETIVARAADGDTEAFSQLVHTYTPLMRGYARRILPVGSPHADDVVQEAFLAAWETLPLLSDPGAGCCVSRGTKPSI